MDYIHKWLWVEESLGFGVSLNSVLILALPSTTSCITLGKVLFCIFICKGG